MAMIGQFPGLKTLYAHGHDGSTYVAFRKKSFGAADLDRANNDVARPFIRFKERFATPDDHIVLFQHAFVQRLQQKGFIGYEFPSGGLVGGAYQRNKEIFDAIMGSL
jgi:hypothetical protein